MKVKIDKEKCFMSGECYYNHPELFEMDEEGYPKILVAQIDDDDMKKHATEAAEVCPAVAIIIEE